MKIQRILAVLTFVNLALLGALLAQGRPAIAGGGDGVLRGKSLEILDDKGRVRASIKLHPADPKVKMPDGTVGVAETVVLRLITPNGMPSVKMGASMDGSGVSFAGPYRGEEWSGVQILAKQAGSTVKLKNVDGKEQVFKP